MHIGFTLTTELLFKLSLDKNVLKNLGHRLRLQIIARGILIPIAILTLVATAFNSSSWITVHFVAQLLLAGSHSELVQIFHPWIRDILFLLALLHVYSQVGFHYILAIEILA